VKEYALIGYPLSHSFSQKYFTEKFEKENIKDVIFHAFSIPLIEELPAILKAHPLLQGFAVTIPYKRPVINYLDEVSEPVQQMNACNCVKMREGKLIGYNTDIIGFEKSFLKQFRPHHKKALILGTGGASSAVAYMLQKLNIDFKYVSRTKDDAKNILGYEDIAPELIKEYTVIINATPLGTYPKVDECPQLPYDALTPQHYLFDLVYNPTKTKFLLLGEQHGAAICNGYEMLVLQAEENWKIWNSD
jgi:shikimate dehydrogenase